MVAILLVGMEEGDGGGGDLAVFAAYDRGVVVFVLSPSLVYSDVADRSPGSVASDAPPSLHH